MTQSPKGKAKELYDRFYVAKMSTNAFRKKEAKTCAIICVEQEYHSLKEMLFNLKSTRVIESNSVYLARLNELDSDLIAIKQEIENI